MSTDFTHSNLSMLLSLLLVIVCITSPANGLDSRKLDEITVPSTSNPPGEEKCSPACVQNPAPPPPPPPAPCPPPPALPPPSLPPPSPKKPPSQYCPPPPPSSYIYITGPPGQLYPIDSDFSGAGPSHLSSSLSVLIGFLLLSLLAFW